MQENWWQTRGHANSFTKIMEARQNRIISKAVSRHKEMKKQLQFEGLDTSQKQNPGKPKSIEQQPAGRGNSSSWLVAHSSSVSERDDGRKALHPSLSSREAGSKSIRRLRDPSSGEYKGGNNMPEASCAKILSYKPLFGGNSNSNIRSTKECWRR